METRMYGEVEEHKHCSHDYWHPACRIHAPCYNDELPIGHVKDNDHSRKSLVPQLDNNARIHIELPMHNGRLSIDNIDACKEMITVKFTAFKGKRKYTAELVIYVEEGSLAIMPTEECNNNTEFINNDPMYNELKVMQIYTGVYDKICKEVKGGKQNENTMETIC